MHDSSLNSIEWNFPQPRRGWLGLWDRFIGPGATPAEVRLQTAIPLLAAVLAPIASWQQSVDWRWYHYLISAVLAFDIVGGVITNATSSAKRWFHRRGQGVWHHMGFVAFHLVHLLLVAILFMAGDLSWVLLPGGYLLLSAAIIVTRPQYLQRPVALTTYVGALVLVIYGPPHPQGLAWFLPLFFFKLLVSHLPREEPYRPGYL